MPELPAEEKDRPETRSCKTDDYGMWSTISTVHMYSRSPVFGGVGRYNGGSSQVLTKHLSWLKFFLMQYHAFQGQVYALH